MGYRRGRIIWGFLLLLSLLEKGKGRRGDEEGGDDMMERREGGG